MSDAIETIRKAAGTLTPAEWVGIRNEIDGGFARAFEAMRTRATEGLADLMDMSPEGYVREWVARGGKNLTKLPSWEKAYQDRGLIERARQLGYIEIGRGPRAPVTLTDDGRAILVRTAPPEGANGAAAPSCSE